jgi:hypothetical protein
MSDEEISEEELHHMDFSALVNFIEMLSLDPSATCHAMGNYNTAWEMQDDIVSRIYVVDTKTIALEAPLRDAIRLLSLQLQSLPEDALSFSGKMPTCHADCLVTMGHAAWEAPRRQAAKIVEKLQPAKKRSEAYFVTR